MSGRAIWKFPLHVEDVQAVLMPEDAEILAIQVQAGQPCLWALVNTAVPRISRWFRLFGTGHPIPYDFTGRFLGTFQLHRGALVFHIFEISDPDEPFQARRERELAAEANRRADEALAERKRRARGAA